jgi:hypothetical protein
MGGYIRIVVDQMLTKRGQWATIGPTLALPRPRLPHIVFPAQDQNP